MTSPLRRKHPITPPSILRSTRPSLYCFVLMLAGCGITPDHLPAQHHAGRRPSASHQRPVAEHRPSSRFADIARAKFFSEPSARTAAVPSAPAPSAPAPLVVPVAAVDEAETFGALQYASGITSSRPGPGEILPVQAIGGGPGGINSQYLTLPPVDDPRKLKKITEIEPYTSYEPNPLIRAKDPCENLCPRPDGAPCKSIGDRALSCPDEVVLSNEAYVPRCFDETVFAWEASNLWYNPIYFEDVPLERYGHTYPCWIQPFASVGKFSVQLVGLPYQMGIDPPWKKIYPLGYYRPGECAPKLHYQIPWNTRAALIQAGVTTGMFYLIP